MTVNIKEIQPHVMLKTSQVESLAIVVGDPARAKQLAELCDSSKELAYNREYRTYKCTFKTCNFIVTSHGVGSAGAAICFEELIQLGVKIIIRAGTAGSLQPQFIKQGDIVICYAAAREDGVSNAMVNKGFPAVADPFVFQTLQQTALEHKVDVKCGITLTSDLFYPSPVLPNYLESYAKSGIDVVEMEVATLLTIAKIRNIKAGAIVCVDGCPFEWNDGNYDPSGECVSLGKKKMLQLVLETAVKLITIQQN